MKCDAIVIGSGLGGNPRCHRLADKGLHVPLVEGPCLNGRIFRPYGVGETGQLTEIEQAGEIK